MLQISDSCTIHVIASCASDRVCTQHSANCRHFAVARASQIASLHGERRPVVVIAPSVVVAGGAHTSTLAATSVVWRLAEGRDADEDLDVLGYWLTSQAPPAMQICHHLHGGM